MKVSVVLPCRNEGRYIAGCLDSFLATAWPRDELELLIVDGGSTDNTSAVVARYAARYPWIRLLDNPGRIVPTALNIGIRAATGDVIVRMDAHVVYPPEYLPRLVAALVESGADNVGGAVVTLPANTSPMAQAIAVALSHPFGVGNSWFRIGATGPRWVDTVPFGCFRRELFGRIGLFDEELVRNQDEELNYRIIRAGGRVLLLPDVVSYYYARETPRQAARMLYQYGCFKPLVARKVGRIFTLRQLVPPAFVASLIITAALALVWPVAALALAGIVVAYSVAAIISAAGVAGERGLACAARLAGVFPLLHIAYGFGFLRGLASAFTTRPARWLDPAVVPLSR